MPVSQWPPPGGRPDLSVYRQLRNFRLTPEPTGNEPLLEELYTGNRAPAGVPGTFRGRYLGDTPVRLPPRPSPDARWFVVHKHAATRLHYDLRLELDGVLKSWAVPKGLPQDPAARHLAVQTEDHPLAYLVFEGVIPEGNYGAGTVEIWDWGYYLPHRFDDRKIVVALMGHRVAGGYQMVRTRGDHWLLFRLTD